MCCIFHIRAGFRLTVISLLMLFAIEGKAQELIKDFESRVAIGYNTDISKKWDISFEHEVRMDENSTRLRRSLTTIGLDYEVERWFRLGINYRGHFARQGDNSYGFRHRIMGDVVLRGYYHRYMFTYRLRGQYERRGYNYPENRRSIPVFDSRNTFKVNYRINRMYRPFVSFDARHAIRDREKDLYPLFDRYRIVTGLDVALSNRYEMSLYFMYNEEINVVRPVARYVLGVEFLFGARRPILGS